MERSTQYTPAPSSHMTPHINVDYMTNKQRDRPGRFMSCMYNAILTRDDKVGGKKKGAEVHRTGAWDTRMHPKVLAAQKNHAKKGAERLTKRQLQ